MKEFSASDAKNSFGEVLAALVDGPVRITKNNRLVAHIVAATDSRPRAPVTEPRAVEDLLRRYAAGALRRADLLEQTGLSFGEILQLLGRYDLSLPRVKASQRYSPRQRALLGKVFGQ